MPRFNFFAAAGLVSAFVVSWPAVGRASTVETYSNGTDLGLWNLTTNTTKPRVLQTTGGNGGAFLEQDNVAGGLPKWETASPDFEPNAGFPYENYSPYVGNYKAAGVTAFSLDVNIIKPGNWATDRAPTLHLGQWDKATDSPSLDAYYTGADLPDDVAPTGWNTYSFAIDSKSTTIPAGWSLERGDGTTATDADWASLMQRVDLLTFGFYKQGFFYSSLGSWSEGIDNVTISTTPEPATLAATLGALMLGAGRRRR